MKERLPILMYPQQQYPADSEESDLRISPRQRSIRARLARSCIDIYWRQRLGLARQLAVVACAVGHRLPVNFVAKHTPPTCSTLLEISEVGLPLLGSAGGFILLFEAVFAVVLLGGPRLSRIAEHGALVLTGLMVVGCTLSRDPPPSA